MNDDVSLEEEEAEGLGVGLEGRQGFRHAIMFGTKEAVVLKQNRGMPVKNNYAVDVLCRTLLVWYGYICGRLQSASYIIHL